MHYATGALSPSFSDLLSGAGLPLFEKLSSTFLSHGNLNEGVCAIRCVRVSI